MDVVFTFLVVLSIDAIAERVPAILNQPEGARRASTRWSIRVDSDYSLEKPFPMLMLVFNTEAIVIALL